MKDIKKHYQDLIKDINLYNDKIVSGLKNYINWLEKKIFELQEESEKKDEHADLQNEIDEYNRLEAQHDMNLEDEITQLKAKLAEKENDLKAASNTIEAWENRFYTLVKTYDINLDKPVRIHQPHEAVVHHCGEGEPKVLKPKTHRKRNKTVVARCKDCGTYFQAKSKIAKYCSECRAEHVKESKAKWLAKQK